MEQIENQLLTLVKGCINNREFMMDTKKITGTTYRNGMFIENYTGVHVRDSHWTINKSFINGEKYPSRSENYKFKTINLLFENEPSINISVELSNEIKHKLNVTETITREGKTFKEKFFNLFKSFSYTKDSIEEIITYNYQYKLVCGEFKIDLTFQEVDELVNLYETNIVKFKKQTQAIEIMKRIKKYVK
jgi:hypothetical protein